MTDLSESWILQPHDGISFAFNLMSAHFAWDKTVESGTLELTQNGETVECALIMFDQFKTELPKHLSERA